MSHDIQNAVLALNQAYVHLHPEEACQTLSELPVGDIIELLQSHAAHELVMLWDGLTLDVAAEVLPRLPDASARQVMQRGDPVHTARVLVRCAPATRERLLAELDAVRRRELSELVRYPEESAGALMDPRFVPLYESLTVREALHRIRKLKPPHIRQLYLIDAEGELRNMVEVSRLALADPATLLSTLAEPVSAVVTATASKHEVGELLEQHRITDLPVVDLAGRLIGVIRYDALMEAVREESSADLLTMVGASRDERALSPVGFVVRKRLPWLSINLLTAFLAASVVGIFENTIAQFTALAVLLPVVAGQSGNTGAQALAVTMRGLALREIGTSQWLRVAHKEIGAAFFNGVAIALMTSIGVLVWSSSTGLSLVIGLSMVIAMLAAAFSGVIIPIALSALGQDPAQSSSIILTTVTDVVGFFAFLGIATLLSGML